MNTTCLLLSFAFAAAFAPPGAAAGACPACGQAEPPAGAPGFTGRSLYPLDARWTTDTGTTVQLGEFLGRPVVLTMFFSSCGNACPRLVGDLPRMQAALPAAGRTRTLFILVSFDDRHDTVGVLHAYRERAGLDGLNWVLLRGVPGDIQELAAVLGVKFKRTADGYYEHSNLITVLNSDGAIAFQRPGLDGSIAGAVHAIITVASK